MLHRMALRVLPSLSLAVTEDSVRKRKRIVMFVPGLVAFAVYRAAKHALPLSEPLVLLALGSLVAMVAAVAAYRVGREAGWPTIFREDHGLMLGWLAGWIGAVYGIQLSLLVLALLWLVGYNYLQHPDGPAMMAIIISSTAVARDAFEIGHVRRLALMGRPFLTFPDGMALRDMVRTRVRFFAPWVVAGAVLGALLPLSGGLFDLAQATALAQLLGVTVIGGALALGAYFAGLYPDQSWIQSLQRTAPSELFKYWWWPGMAFASTYYLVAMGGLLFVLRQPSIPVWPGVVAGALVAAMMGLYGYYLGHRRRVEDLERPQLSSGMLRCPFVMGILGKAGASSAVLAGGVAVGKSGSKG
jgi:predicted membrane protein